MASDRSLFVGRDGPDGDAARFRGNPLRSLLIGRGIEDQTEPEAFFSQTRRRIAADITAERAASKEAERNEGRQHPAGTRTQASDSQTIPRPSRPSSPPPATARAFVSHYSFGSIDRAFKANLARLTLGLSPAVPAEQTFDWLAHLAISPGKQMELAENALSGSARLCRCAVQAATQACVPPFAPLPQDRRFQAQDWQQWPYNLIYQSFLATEEWW